MMYLITANVNVGGGLRRRAYDPADPVATVGYYDVEADSPQAAAQAAYDIGNRMAADTEGRTWPADVRSLSVGDLLYVAGADESVTILAVARYGFDEVAQPPNRLQVPLGGQDLHTSRPHPQVRCEYAGAPAHDGLHPWQANCRHPLQVELGELPEPDYSCHCGSGQCRRHGTA